MKFKLKKSTRKGIDNTSIWLSVVGAINWGLSVFNWNVVEVLANATRPFVGIVVYSAVGISGLWIGGRMLMGKLFK